MKRAISVLLIFLVLSVFCSCGDNAAYAEGNLLFDCGIESVKDIDGCTSLSGNSAEMITITDKDYEYAEDYPQSELHELFIFPDVNCITLSVNNKNYILYLMENGDIGVKPTENSAYKIYRANTSDKLTQNKIDELIVKYGGKLLEK